MPTIVTLSKAKAKLSELVTRVEAGESFEITRGGKTVAWLHWATGASGGSNPTTAPEAEHGETGVMRPAPAAGILFPPAAEEHPQSLAGAPRATQEPRSDPAPARDIQKLPPFTQGPKIKPAGAESVERKLARGLTLADITKASSS